MFIRIFNFVNTSLYYNKSECSCYLYKNILKNTQNSPILLQSFFIASIKAAKFDISKILLPKVHLTLKMLDKMIRQCNLNGIFLIFSICR